jgi:hypothetical protein
LRQQLITRVTSNIGPQAFLCCVLLCVQVRQAQQMCSLVSRKKAELAAKLQRLQERRNAVAAQLDSSSADAAGAHHAAVVVQMWVLPLQHCSTLGGAYQHCGLQDDSTFAFVHCCSPCSVAYVLF